MARSGVIERNTRETQIRVELTLEGSGQSAVEVPIGFVAHMLQTLARHGMFDLKVSAAGDLHVDEHHLVEDLGIVLGQAFNAALAERRGIRRAGHFMYPMDDALAQAAVDLSGRPYLAYKVEFSGERVGGLDLGLLKEFFHALAEHGRMNLHLALFYGENDHHCAEALFKALARALRMAIEIDPAAPDEVPSTKGSL